MPLNPLQVALAMTLALVMFIYGMFRYFNRIYKVSPARTSQDVAGRSSRAVAGGSAVAASTK